MFTRIETLLGSFGSALKGRPRNRRVLLRCDRQRRLLFESLEDRRLLALTASSDTSPIDLRAGTFDSVVISFSEPIDFDQQGGSFTIDAAVTDSRLVQRSRALAVTRWIKMKTASWVNPMSMLCSSPWKSMTRT